MSTRHNKAGQIADGVDSNGARLNLRVEGQTDRALIIAGLDGSGNPQSLANAVADGVAGGSGSTRTPTITTPSTGGTVAAGKRYIEFIFSTDFAGTIGGQTFSGTTDSSYNLPLLNGADTYAALVYTISAGSARLTTIV